MAKLNETMDAARKGRIEDEPGDAGIFKRPIAAGTETLDFDRNDIDPRNIDIERNNAKIKPSDLDAAIRKANKDRRDGKLSKDDHAKIKQRLDTLLTQVRPGA